MQLLLADVPFMQVRIATKYACQVKRTCVEGWQIHIDTCTCCLQNTAATAALNPGQRSMQRMSQSPRLGTAVPSLTCAGSALAIPAQASSLMAEAKRHF